MSKPKSNAIVVSHSGGGPKKPASKPRRLSLTSVPYLGVLTNPWEGETDGAGRPDFNTLPTVVWREKWAFTATTDANGSLWLTMNPNITNPFYFNTVVSGAATVVGLSTSCYSPNRTSLLTTLSTQRMLAYGFEAEYIYEDQLRKGVMSVSMTSAQPQVGDTVIALQSQTAFKEGDASEKVAVVCRCHDNDFVAVGTGCGDSWLHLNCTGFPASVACVRIRPFFVLEGTVAIGNLMSIDASHTPSLPAHVATGASIVGPNSVSAVGSDPITTLVKYAEKAVNTAGALNGLYQTSKPLLTLLAEFAAVL